MIEKQQAEAEVRRCGSTTAAGAADGRAHSCAASALCRICFRELALSG